MNEEQLENLCLEWFRNNNWEVANGLEYSPDSDNSERKDYKDVVLKNKLYSSIKKINPSLTDLVIEEAISSVLKPKNLDLTQNNRNFHKMLLEGVPVQYTKDDKLINDRVFLIDFDKTENNNFLVINQLTIKGTKQPRRPDIICYINGLPIAVIELKNPTSENTDIWEAFNQLQTYKDEISDLFVYNQALVISDGFFARIGSVTADQERFMPWRTIKNENDKPYMEWQLEIMVKGFFDRDLLLDYIRYFILFESDGETITKKIAAYHQFHAVREAVKATIIASQRPNVDRIMEVRATYGNEVVPGSKKAGVVWHTQGSGKSISMAYYAGKLIQQPEMLNPTLLVVTDRNDLDGQLFQTFSNAQELLRQTPVQVNNRDELRQLLSEKQSGGIIFTTVQKFTTFEEESSHPILNERHNIVVISDEAHRSQYGLKAKLNSKGEYRFGYARHMRDALPNASFIGFTGTPLSSESLEDKDTRAIFGEYVSIYDIQDAVNDGATVNIYYESRLTRLTLHSEIEKLSRQVEEVVEDEEELSIREKTKEEWSTLEKLVGTEKRLKQVAEDLVKHFEERTSIMDGKAIIVAMSREICVHLYNHIIKLKPEWHNSDPEKGAIKIVMTGSASDKPLLQPHIYNKQTKKRLEKRFKDINDPLKLVIVRDMWLTGFDVPCCHTMYVDKPMQRHNLMQAIARVNRVFKNKTGGLVVDYIGIANALKDALKVYIEAKGKGEPSLRAEEAFIILKEKMQIVRDMFHGFNYSLYLTDAHKILIPAINHILELDNGKKRYMDAVLSVNKAFSLCGTLDEAKELHKEIAFFSAIKAALSKYTSVDKKYSLEQKNTILKQILDNAVIAEGVADVFKLAGLERPNIGILSDDFLEEIRHMPQRNLAVELLEKLIKDNIKAKTRNNVVKEKKYSDRLMNAIRNYNNRSIETAQVIEELIQMAKEFQTELEHESNLGLTYDEIAFYDALANNESAVRELGDETLKKIAVEITEKLKNSTTVDWQVRESVRAKLRILVRRTLQKYKYPPDKQPDAVELILKQAEVLSQQWSLN